MDIDDKYKLLCGNRFFNICNSIYLLSQWDHQRRKLTIASLAKSYESIYIYEKKFIKKFGIQV